jgi:hypothetical protein
MRSDFQIFHYLKNGECGLNINRAAEQINLYTPVHLNNACQKQPMPHFNQGLTKHSGKRFQVIKAQHAQAYFKLLMGSLYKKYPDIHAIYAIA